MAETSLIIMALDLLSQNNNLERRDRKKKRETKKKRFLHSQPHNSLPAPSLPPFLFFLFIQYVIFPKFKPNHNSTTLSGTSAAKFHTSQEATQHILHAYMDYKLKQKIILDKGFAHQSKRTDNRFYILNFMFQSTTSSFLLILQQIFA